MRLIKLFFYLFLVSIPFGTRFLVYQFTNGFNEYEAVFLYASDIFLVLFLVSLLRITDNLRIYRFSYPYICTKSVICSLAVFLFFAAISILFAVSKGLAIYNFGRLVLLVLMAFAVARILKEGVVKLENILAIIAGSAIFQSFVGIAQFFKQSSLGLGILGEPVLGADIGGAAKIVVDGAKILRAYGTFPHPNILAAFLILGLVSLYYLFLKFEARSTKYETISNDQNPKRFNKFEFKILNLFRISIFGFSIFVIFLGLLFAFSRTAWLLAILATIAIIIYSRNLRLGVLIAAIAGIFLIGFNSYIFPRAQVSAGEPSVSYRLTYNKLGLDLIKNNLLGIGIGNQVFYSVKSGLYQKFGMDQAWQWQPIHNIYLLIGSEMGILGLLAFLIFLTKLIIHNSLFVIPKVMLMALLLFGLFDHFLWTLQPGRLMLWLVIGILMGVNSAHRSMDRAQPSEG